ncbi:hypothetical protein H9Q10_06295 [Eikenella sp. S3360]|uniref:Uncharacterized protein n=1 Tax=Eikenella glucosivorans TaxID=2766967 RepID=A0ABS0NAF1_9NEIS|nr:hypothetical protein [Eikenella glucosivorans]MBH5329278.1 hypothetical protein [Eikenella glucosivorans]
MVLHTFLENFPWRRFATPYESHAKGVKQNILNILAGSAAEKDYEQLIDSLESQAWLVKLSPWGLKLCLALLAEDKPNKALLLKGMRTLFEAANYSTQSPQTQAFKETKGKALKYEAFKEKLFDPAFDGAMDDEFLKITKTLDRHYLHVSILEMFAANQALIVGFASSEDKEVARQAVLLAEAIKNPKQYPCS